MPQPDTRHLEVVEIGSLEVIKRLDVSSRSDREVERILRGMLINLNTDRYFVRDTTDE